MIPIVGPWRQRLPNTRFAAPDAPFPAAQGGHQWFHVDGQELRPDHVEFGEEAFDQLIAGLLAREGFEDALDRVAFVRVSQGSTMALDAVATGSWTIATLVSFEGLLPLRPTAMSDRTPILLVHGQDDTRIALQAPKVAAGLLRAAGFDAKLEVLKGIGHMVSAEGAELAVTLLR